MAVKILGIYGSPREGGNSDILLDRALEGARKAGATVKTLYAREFKIGGCRECGDCDPTGQCSQYDEMQPVYPLLEEADAIIVSTPIFFYAMPAQVKALIDRCQAMWNRRRLNKSAEGMKRYDSGKGYLIAVGATRGKNLFECVALTAKYFYDALDMSYEGGIFYRQVEGKGDIKRRPDALAEAEELGKKAAAG